MSPTPLVASLTESFLAAAVFGGFLYVLGEIYFRVRNVDGLGLGDVKMVAMMGAFWGFGETFLTLILGSVVAAVTGLLMVLAGRKQWSYALPFGSYLGATAILVMLWGGDILNWYWGLVLPQ
jgi:leader peptidase (prepilin peptidase)/N-methyltransferase